jgi:ATP-binding cassette, subfamily B, bacterial
VPPRGSLSFRNVTFRYPTRPEIAALADFTLEVEPGETVAIVGPSGAGKSTMFQLAERFYDPQAGTIRLDGVPLTERRPRRGARADRDGAAGRRFVQRQRARQSCATAPGRDRRAGVGRRAGGQCGAVPRRLPRRARHLSGRKRQPGCRAGSASGVAIARAVLRDAPMLLLDEATSALDAESERLVQDALDHLMHDRTTIVIAHRLATVRAADRIVVMDRPHRRGGQT